MPTAFVSNAFDPATSGTLAPDLRAMIERRERVLGPCYRLFYDEPVHAVRAEGVWIHDADGRRYLDAYNNVPQVGHCHPHVVAAVTRQLGALNTHTRYLFDTVLTYAERLTATFPPALSQVMLTCSGSEATDLALRIARAGGNEGIIVTRDAYHGTTAAAAEVSPSRGTPGPRVRTVAAPDAYRFDGDPAQLGAAFAADVAQAMDAFRRDGIGFAGLLIDTVFSSDGFHVGPAGFLKPAADLVQAAGGIVIADEIQAGFGRTGSHMWGFERHGILPDLVLLGKSMGNGLPIGGVVARPALLAQFGRSQRYFNTFGGNPVSSAAGLAVLEVIEREDLRENARRVGGLLLDGLKQLAGKYPAIGDVRGAGLFLGVDFVKDSKTKEPDSETALGIVNAMRKRNVLINALGPYRNVLKIRPPLPFSEENAEQLLATLDDVMAE